MEFHSWNVMIYSPCLFQVKGQRASNCRAVFKPAPTHRLCSWVRSRSFGWRASSPGLTPRSVSLQERKGGELCSEWNHCATPHSALCSLRRRCFPLEISLGNRVARDIVGQTVHFLCCPFYVNIAQKKNNCLFLCWDTHTCHERKRKFTRIFRIQSWQLEHVFLLVTCCFRSLGMKPTLLRS